VSVAELKCRPADVDREAFLRLREMGLLPMDAGGDTNDGGDAGDSSFTQDWGVMEAPPPPMDGG
jgi:hypothetical protein